MNKLRLVFVLIAISTYLSGCQSYRSASRGASSGGGGYVGENAAALLASTSKDLSDELERSSPNVLKALPAGWDAARFANVIRAVRSSPDLEMKRDGKDLMFNYGVDASGPYIEALKPFFTIYDNLPTKFRKKVPNESIESSSENEITLDVRLKLIHEAGHLLGLDESAAEKFGFDVLSRLEKDFYFCKVPLSDVANVSSVLSVSPTSVYYSFPNGRLVTQPEAGAEIFYGFNWIHANGWIFHRSKAQLVLPQEHTTYYSYALKSPFEQDWENWSKEAGGLGEFTAKIISRYTLIPQEPASTANDFVFAEKLESWNGQASTLKVAVHQDSPNAPISMRVEAPLMKVTVPTPNNVGGSYVPGPLASRGEYTGEFHGFETTCEYYGTK